LTSFQIRVSDTAPVSDQVNYLWLKQTGFDEQVCTPGPFAGINQNFRTRNFLYGPEEVGSVSHDRMLVDIDGSKSEGFLSC
jgi:hypothetical protein